MEPTTVNAVSYTWKNDDGTFFVKIYDSESGIYGSATHKDRATAMTLAKTYFTAEYKNLIEVAYCDVLVEPNVEEENDLIQK